MPTPDAVAGLTCYGWRKQGWGGAASFVKSAMTLTGLSNAGSCEDNVNASETYF